MGTGYFPAHRQLITGVLITFIAAGATAQPTKQPRLEAIRERGHLTCGVWPKVEGFSVVDRNGRYAGFDVDICRALAAGVLGSPDKVRFVQVASVFAFLGTRDIDVVSRRLTWGMSREQFGVLFGPITFYDGQGFLVPKKLGIKRLQQLAGARVCVEPKSLHETNLDVYVKERRVALRKVPVPALPETRGSFDETRCAAYSADISELGAIRSSLPNPQEYDILDEQISKEPLAQLVRSDDPVFFGILRWTAHALILAEELGITSSNVEAMLKSANPEVQRLLGVAEGAGPTFGLDERWAYHIIKGVGNYAEIFERNLGQASPIKLARGLNRLWTAGGLLYAPPLQ
jgi:general L-amino acid transport system substrate-binding protein